MNCEQFHELVESLARDEALDGTLVQEALAHADSCGPCDALLEESEALTRNLGQLARQYRSEQAPAHIEKNLLRVLRGRRAPKVPPKRARWLLLAGAGSIAAAALVVVLLIGRGRFTAGGASIGQLGAKNAGVASGPGNTAADSYNLAESSLNDEENPADSFLPLSPTFDPSSLDDDTMVRVVLSRSALESLGLPLNVGGDSQVVADLIVSSDGTPQAIRLIGRYDPNGS